MSTFNLDNIPAMMPPPGHTPNFDNPEDMHQTVFAVGVATMILTVTALAVRIYTKAVILKEMRAEEWLAILGTVGIITWDSMFVYVSSNGFSRHLYDVRLTEVPNLSYMSYLAEITNAPTMFAAKCSILFQFRRLFCTGQTRDSIFWSIHVLIFLCGAYYISAIFTFTFQCIPREKTWNPFLEGQCIDVAAAIVVQGSINLFLDIGILITPLWAIWRLQLPMKRKLGISAVFGVGVLTCAIAAVGVSVRIPLLSDMDLTWIISKVGIWTMIEYCGTIIVGCMPSFPRFFLHIRGKDGQPAASHAATAGSGGSKTHPSRFQHSHNNSKGFAAPQPAYYPSSHIRQKSVNSGVGVAITTSEVSFMDPSYIELEDGTVLRSPGRFNEESYVGGGGDSGYATTERGSRERERERERPSTQGSVSDISSRSSGDRRSGCRDDGDWSPLSSPR